MIYAIILFALTYVGMLAFQKIRPYIALGSALIFVVSGMLPLKDVLGSIDFNVIFMIAGTMGIVAVVIESKMPYLLADIIIEKVPNVKWAIITLSLFAGVVSAFIDNVATVLMIAPIALCVAKELDINPVGMIIAISVSSNLQGAATLVGDTTAIMLGGYAGINFLEFFWYQGKPSIFWAVELGAVASALLLVVIFKKENGPVKACGCTEVNDYVPTIMLGATVLLLIIASIIPNMPHMINGIICMCMLVITLVYTWLKNRSIKAVLSAVKEIDFDTILLLLGLFIV
ncbi:MAG: arsenic transporter, partial [Oscillospiraceae bacterium]|nr:arsenic transporter [Oscillospiraceae bacterium]